MVRPWTADRGPWTAEELVKKQAPGRPEWRVETGLRRYMCMAMGSS